MRDLLAFLGLSVPIKYIDQFGKFGMERVHLIIHAAVYKSVCFGMEGVLLYALVCPVLRRPPCERPE